MRHADENENRIKETIVIMIFKKALSVSLKKLICASHFLLVFIRQTIKEITSYMHQSAIHVDMRPQADMWKKVTVLRTFSGAYIIYTQHMW
jgi:hypothetical protein